MVSRGRLRALVLFGLACAPTRLAHAESPVTCASSESAAPAVADADVDARLAFVRGAMADQAQRARTWSWTWGSTGVALSGAYFTFAALQPSADARIDPATVGVVALFVPAFIVLKPFAVIPNQAALEADIAEGGADRCATLARAERLLSLSADDEAFRAGVIPQALTIGTSVTVALFLGLGFGHWRGALVAGGAGLTVGEIRLLTLPTGAITALARYRRGEIAPPTPNTTALRFRIVPIVEASDPRLGTAAIRGLAVGAAF